MARPRRSIAALAMLAVVTAHGLALPAARAEQAQPARSEPSAVERCLTLADGVSEGAPEYPMEAFKRGISGRVKAELVFTLPDRAPAVNILESSSDRPADEPTGLSPADFEGAVRGFARHYRVPCLTPPEAPARFSIEYLFRPDRREARHGQPTDLDREARDALWRCVRHVDGGRAPDYPLRALRAGLQGRVLARLRFTAPDTPPESTIAVRDGAEPLADTIRDWVAGLRMPCQTGGSYETTVTYVFVLEGEAYGFKPGLGFLQLLGAVAPAQRAQMPRDTTTMACPFDVRLIYTQPHLPNDVDSLSEWTPARQPFLDWLRTIELNLPKRSLDSVFADSTVFTVPCLKIQPTP